MSWFRQFLMLFVAVLVVMFIIYILRRAGGNVPVIGPVVRTVFN